MRNTYRITDYRELGLPSVEVYGDRFHYQDLYKLVGKDQFMTTFQLKTNSSSYEQFGKSVLGVIFYDPKTLEALKHNESTDAEISKSKIRIDCPSLDISKEAQGDLKYNGVNIADIESILFLPYKKESEKYDTGEKKIPDIIEIKADFSGVDVDILNQNYLVSKNNSGTNLIQYEKEQLVGITLALNNDRIDSRILSHFGFTESDLKTNLNIWTNLYKAKERRNQLNELDSKKYNEIKNILLIERFTKIVKELGNAGLSNSVNEFERNILKNIFESIEKFSPSVLLHGENQVYWDFDSYVHIALKHLKDYQLGNYRNKTPFPYKADDLNALIEKVLYLIEHEIDQYFLGKTTSDFTRHGSMAIFYNGDHYNLRIACDGRLTQFHTI